MIMENFCNSLEMKIKENIACIEATHINDPDRIIYYDKIESLLLEDKQETMELLRECNNIDIFSHIAALLDRLPGKFASQELLSLFESVISKFGHDRAVLLNLNMAIDELKSELAWLAQEENRQQLNL
jgi:hypothetical protein